MKIYSHPTKEAILTILINNDCEIWMELPILEIIRKFKFDNLRMDVESFVNYMDITNQLPSFYSFLKKYV